MIVERLFTGQSEVELPTCQSLNTRDLSVIEENAIYYAAGYTIHKLIRKYGQMDSRKSKEFVDILYNMLGEDPISIEAHSTYMDYVKVWTKANDRGGLTHVSLDTFHCFKVIEMVTYDLIKNGSTKEEVMSKVFITENVRLQWMLICDLHDEAESFELLQDVIGVWFTIRGFTIAGKLFEDYKKATKSNVRGKKGLRKELH